MTNFDKFTFPGDYFDYTDGVPSTDSEIDFRIKEGIQRIKDKVREGVENPSYNFATGNLLITIFAYKQDNCKYTLYVHVSKGYLGEVASDIIL
jgi:hypothetical protein